MKILLVDDDVFLRDMYATKFTEKGDAVSSAGSPEEALRIVENETFDAVIMDMVMPGMTGIDLLKACKALPIKVQPTYIVLSNQGEESDIQKAYAEGATGYIIS
jgi:CheY-like chemotaxis protein